MSAPLAFPSLTSTHALPLLFSGQAQKEISINQSLLMLDALLQKSIEATMDTPPQAPEEGSVYRVGANPVAEWESEPDNLAIWLGGAWFFITPYNGLKLYDREKSHLIHFGSSWQEVTEPSVPAGGITVDTEARQAIAGIIDALRALGVWAPSGA